MTVQLTEWDQALVRQKMLGDIAYEVMSGEIDRRNKRDNREDYPGVSDADLAQAVLSEMKHILDTEFDQLKAEIIEWVKNY